MKDDLKCCVADLVEHPCTQQCGCTGEFVRLLRTLVKSGILIDTGKRRDGEIVWRRSEMPLRPDNQ